jgi:hypothetical protein
MGFSIEVKIPTACPVDRSRMSTVAPEIDLKKYADMLSDSFLLIKTGPADAGPG